MIQKSPNTFKKKIEKLHSLFKKLKTKNYKLKKEKEK
jgi:hypothetical protein